MSEESAVENNSQNNSDEKLQEELTRIANIADTLPEIYRVKCFELLLSNMLQGSPLSFEQPKIKNEPPISKSEFKIPLDVRAFFQQWNVSEEQLQKIFLIDSEDEIVPIYKLKTTAKSKAQIEIALLLALENTLKQTSKFGFTSEDVRKRCLEHKCYDVKNFTTHFKNKQKLFRGLTDMENVLLSPEGKQELANLVNRF